MPGRGARAVPEGLGVFVGFGVGVGAPDPSGGIDGHGESGSTEMHGGGPTGAIGQRAPGTNFPPHDDPYGRNPPM